VRWRNEQAGSELVPASVLDRPPSAELRHEQRDDESLPPYDVLDRPPSAELRYEQRDDESLPPYDVLDEILQGYVELDLDADELARRGLPPDEVERVIRMVDRAEYKRRQAPPGVRVSTKAFGRDRRLPITNRFRGR
jgi:NAD+ synthase (glutamine-hydrolysing)